MPWALCSLQLESGKRQHRRPDQGGSGSWRANGAASLSQGSASLSQGSASLSQGSASLARIGFADGDHAASPTALQGRLVLRPVHLHRPSQNPASAAWRLGLSARMPGPPTRTVDMAQPVSGVGTRPGKCPPGGHDPRTVSPARMGWAIPTNCHAACTTTRERGQGSARAAQDRDPARPTPRPPVSPDPRETTRHPRRAQRDV
jgi:hypothetical protein